MNSQKVVIISAPSGAGKTTLVKQLLLSYPNLEFSISACSRPKRENEKHGVDYYFLSVNEFKNLIKQDQFIEWEEVYPDRFYGTLKKEIERIWKNKHIVLFDVDVKGGIHLKNIFREKAISIFIAPPSVEILKERLINRGTETPETIKTRVEKAEYEMTFSNQFDFIVVNDKLDIAIQYISSIIKKWITNYGADFKFKTE